MNHQPCIRSKVFIKSIEISLNTSSSISKPHERIRSATRGRLATAAAGNAGMGDVSANRQHKLGAAAYKAPRSKSEVLK